MNRNTKASAVPVQIQKHLTISCGGKSTEKIPDILHKKLEIQLKKINRF